jgi:hypothetical protein
VLCKFGIRVDFSKSAIIRQIDSNTKHVLQVPEYLFVVFIEKVNSIIENSLANLS